jgi:hypothetical protein
MSEHIVKEILEKYGRRELDSAERIKTILHLSKCNICHNEYQKMFPNQTNPNQNVSLPLIDNEPFHLEFEEHLQPFVDNQISEVDRVIVESHIKNCDYCATSLRDLQEFSNTLRLQKIVDEQGQREGFWQRVSGFVSNNFRPLALAFSVLFAICLGLFWWINTPKIVETDIVEVLPTPNVSPLAINSQTPQIANTNISNSNKNTQNQNIQNKNANIPTPTPNPTITPQETELAELKLPNYLKDLRTKTDNLRGNNDGRTEQIVIVSPHGIVIRESSPSLNFKKLEGVEFYEISIYDGSTQIRKETISANSWRVPVNLPKGKLYEWQVSAKSGDQNYLGQGKFYVISQADGNKIRQAKDTLQRGKTFAEAGLIEDAKREFQQYLKQNPGSQTAKNALKQLSKSN